MVVSQTYESLSDNRQDNFCALENANYSQMAEFMHWLWVRFRTLIDGLGAQLEAVIGARTCAGLYTDKALAQHDDHPAKSTHHEEPGQKKDHCRAKPLPHRASPLASQKQHVSADCAGLDEAEQAKAKCKQQGLIGEIHKCLSSYDKFDDGPSTNHNVKRYS